MINQIQFGNYKAFKEGKLKIKPITILLGSNSAGKSSLIQLILMLTQTFESNKNRQNCLQLNGDLVKLGESKNIFHNKKTNLVIDLNLGLINTSYDSIYDQLNEEIENLHYVLSRLDKLILPKHISRAKKHRPIDRMWIDDFETKSASAFLSKFTSLKRSINKSISLLNENEIKSLVKTRLNVHRFGYRGDQNMFNIKDKKLIIDFAPLKHAHSFSETLFAFSPNEVDFKYKVGYVSKTKSIQIIGFSISSKDRIILEYQYNRLRKGKYHVLNSDIFDNKILDKYSSKFGNSIDLTNMQIYKPRFKNRRRFSRNYFVDFLLSIVRESLSSINRTLNYKNINYINPLRAYPRRYYFQDEVINSSSVHSLDSIHLIDLFRERPEIKKRVNTWMKKFNINIDIAQLEEVIHKIKVHHSGLSLDMTDVGFGISQVMPIITQCYLSDTNSITLIEQPEIHLHPKMQADLADLFIESCKAIENNKNFIIETHSEYLLKRLRRRVSEGKIQSKDVGIYFIHAKNDKDNFAKVEEIEINEKGDFLWPKDFYEVDLEDTVEFLKNQN